MEEQKLTLSADQITVERFPLASSTGTDLATLTPSYKIVNGEGSDGDTDGSESDGDDARF